MVTPHRRHVRPNWLTLVGGLGTRASFAPLGSPSPHNSTTQRTESCSSLGNAGPSEQQISPAPPAIAASVPDLVRERRAYQTALALHRSYLWDADRSVIPKKMKDFRQPPDSTDVFGQIDWLAERDAIVDRALALGYVIGALENVVSGPSAWSAVAVGQVCGASFSYPIGSHDTTDPKRLLKNGGDAFSRALVPENGDAVLLKREWSMLNDKDTELRPSIRIPCWFLP